jgi:hypothetical protein
MCSFRLPGEDISSCVNSQVMMATPKKYRMYRSIAIELV